MSIKTRLASARTNLPAVFLPALVLVIGLAVTVAAFLWTQSRIEEDLAHKFAIESEQITVQVQQQFTLQEEALRGLVGLHAASNEVTRADFRAYVALSDFARRFPAAVDIRYAHRLRRQELPAWQRQVAASLAAVGEAPRAPAPQPEGARDEYLLVEYIHPFDPAKLGLDLLQSPERRSAIAQLEAGATFALSERLAAEYPETPHYALLARLPARKGDPLPGTLALIFRPDRLMPSVTAITSLDLELYDRPAIAPLGREIPPVFDTHAKQEPAHAASGQFMQLRLPLKVGEAEWTLVVTALPDWAPLAQSYWIPFGVGSVGVLLTLLLALATLFLM